MNLCEIQLLILSILTPVRSYQRQSFSQPSHQQHQIQEKMMMTKKSNIDPTELDIRDRIIQDLGMQHRPDIDHVSYQYFSPVAIATQELWSCVREAFKNKNR